MADDKKKQEQKQQGPGTGTKIAAAAVAAAGGYMAYNYLNDDDPKKENEGPGQEGGEGNQAGSEQENPEAAQTQGNTLPEGQSQPQPEGQPSASEQEPAPEPAQLSSEDITQENAEEALGAQGDTASVGGATHVPAEGMSTDGLMEAEQMDQMYNGGDSALTASVEQAQNDLGVSAENIGDLPPPSVGADVAVDSGMAV